MVYRSFFFYDPDRDEWNNDSVEAPLCWAVYNSPPLTKEEKKAEKVAIAERRKFRETVRIETDYCLPNLVNDCAAIVKQALGENKE